MRRMAKGAITSLSGLQKKSAGNNLWKILCSDSFPNVTCRCEQNKKDAIFKVQGKKLLLLLLNVKKKLGVTQLSFDNILRNCSSKSRTEDTGIKHIPPHQAMDRLNTPSTLCFWKALPVRFSRFQPQRTKNISQDRNIAPLCDAGYYSICI